MPRLDRYLSSFILAAALVAPALLVAGAPAQEANVQVRIYDHDHHDYHNWDNREDRAYRHYLEEKHAVYVEYEKQHHSVQKHYWNWRHAHPDHD